MLDIPCRHDPGARNPWYLAARASQSPVGTSLSRRVLRDFCRRESGIGTFRQFAAVQPPRLDASQMANSNTAVLLRDQPTGSRLRVRS